FLSGLTRFFAVVWLSWKSPPGRAKMSRLRYAGYLSPVAGLALLLSLPRGVPTQEAPSGSTQAKKIFSDRIAPLLKENCVECHNSSKARGGLDLSTQETLQAGGDKGPVIVAGDAAKSRLYQMISGQQPKMPRQKPPLSKDAIAAIKQWIELGAPWPSDFTL